MVRSTRLLPIKKLAQNKEKAAAQELAKFVEKQKLESSRLTQLEQYRHEYLADMEGKVKQGVNGATLQHYHQFLAKLDSAIKQQLEVLQRCDEQINTSQGHWKSKRSKAKAITQVMDKMQVKEQKVQDKQEAAQLDEMSTQAFLRRQMNNSSQ